MLTKKEEIRRRIRAVARALGDELPNVVFVGGAAVSLYPAPADPRMTNDVDVVVNVTRTGYVDLISRLKKAGFRECRDEGAPVCRYEYRAGKEKLVVDVMPASGEVLGFTNRWFEGAIAHAQPVALGAGLRARVISPLYFIATKLEAFKHRGNADYLASPDLEDIILVLEATPTLLEGLGAGKSEADAFVRSEFARLVQRDAFCDAVAFAFEGEEAGRERASKLLAALQSLALAESATRAPSA